MLQIRQTRLPFKQVALLILGMFAFFLCFQVQHVQASPKIEVKKVRDLLWFDKSVPGTIAYNGNSYIYKDYKSDDGLNWYQYDKKFYDENNKETSIGDEEKTLWDGKRFVMTGDDDEIGTSIDGITWNTTRISHKDPDKMYVIQDFLFVNGTYYFVAQDRPKNPAYYEELGGSFYIAGPNYFFTSKDLKSFKLGTKEGMTVSSFEERPIWNLMWTGKYFVGNGNASVISKDGIHWIGGDSKKFTSSFTISDNLSYAWDGKKFLTATYDSDGSYIATSVDGVKWKKVLRTNESKISFTNIAFNGKEYIAVGSGKVFYYSLDGVKWSEVQLDSKGADIYSIQATRDGFFIAGKSIYSIKNQDLHTPSKWAESDIQKAIEHQLVSDDLLNYYRSNITRQDFSRTIIQLYEALTGVTAQAAPNNPFSDTTDSYILKAYELGIVQGSKNGKFAPNDPITRQDISIMLYKTLKASGIEISAEGNSWQASYRDVDQVAAYATQALQFFNYNQIINGKENNQLVPKGNTTKEEAIVLLERVFEKYNTRPIVEQEEIIPASGIEAIQAVMTKKGYSFTLDSVTASNFIAYVLKNKQDQRLVVYEQSPPDNFYSSLTFKISYTAKEDYKLQLLQEMIEIEKGVELPGLSDQLKDALAFNLDYGETKAEEIEINGEYMNYAIIRKSEKEEYMVYVYYQAQVMESE